MPAVNTAPGEPTPSPKPQPIGHVPSILLLSLIFCCVVFILWRRASAVRRVVGVGLKSLNGTDGPIRLSTDDGPSVAEFLEDDYDEDAPPPPPSPPGSTGSQRPTHKRAPTVEGIGDVRGMQEAEELMRRGTEAEGSGAPYWKREIADLEPTSRVIKAAAPKMVLAWEYTKSRITTLPSGVVTSAGGGNEETEWLLSREDGRGAMVAGAFQDYGFDSAVNILRKVAYPKSDIHVRVVK
ncbi:hypothetical protein BDZ89DRAFT_1114751 [Hymenopellis radicata]|nr:hypothetical protein BDZ89DRAFT_1114751 [Hymenopellis radicata]